MQWTDELINLFDFIGSLVCHQRSDRMIFVGGHYLPVCARDTGVFVGLIVGYLLVIVFRSKKSKGPPNLLVAMAMMLPLLIDSFSQLFGLRTSTNDLRLLTGLLFGSALAPLLTYSLALPPLNGSLPLLGNLVPATVAPDSKDYWLSARSLCTGIAFSCVLFLAIKLVDGSELVLFYWMLSVPLVIMAVMHFFVLPTLLLISVLVLVVHRRRGTHKLSGNNNESHISKSLEQDLPQV